MFEFFVVSQFISSLIISFIGIGILLFIRKKTENKIKENNPAGFWIRAICLGVDASIIDLLASLFAYRGSLAVSGQITVLITLSYFFFGWMFWSATPAMRLARIKILSLDNKSIKIWQIFARLGVFILLFVGWVFIFFDKKDRKTLHDIVAKTRVVYSLKAQAGKTENRVKKIQLGLLILAVALLGGLMVNGLGERLPSGFKENNQIDYFDLNRDNIPDGITLDTDGNGMVDIVKYDLNNDHIVDFTTFDTDKDGVAESIDINNDGRVDGFDFDNDNKIDISLASGQLFIWLWRGLFGVWVMAFATLIIVGIVKEKQLKT